MRRWSPGETVVLREVWQGRVWTARPVAVVQDADDQQMFSMPPGVVWKCAAGRDGRRLRLPEPEWTLQDRALEPNHVLSFAWPGVAHAVLLFFDAGSAELLRWYINLEEPLRRTPVGFDYFDHTLDIVVAPDLSSWEWKDEDELDEAVRRGIFSAHEARRFREEGERALTRLLNREPPFDRDWRAWRPDPAWPLPELPPGWDVI